MIVTTWLNAMRDILYGDCIDNLDYMAIGTGTTAVTASDTTLETEVFPDASNNRGLVSSRTKPTDGQVRFQMSLTSGQGNGHILTEVGLLNSDTSGILGNRIIHTPISKDSTFELKYQILFTLTDV